MTTCNECGADEPGWQHVHTIQYTGRKKRGSRQDTKRDIFECKNCGAEAKVFTDGVDGTVTHSGAMR